MTGSGSPGLRVDLDWLLGLPLEGPALTILWSAVRDQLSAEATPSPQTKAAWVALEGALARQELLTIRQRCLGGDWFEGLAALEELLEHPKSQAEPPLGTDTLLTARVLAEVMVELHHHLIDPDAPPSPFDEDQRAELMWRAHEFLVRLELLPGPRPPQLPVVIEQINRRGALAWMDRSSSLARSRAIDLLLRLCAVNPDARKWALPAIRGRLSEEVQEMALSNPHGPIEAEGLARLLRWCEGLATVDPPGEPARVALRQALLRGRLSLDLLQSGGF